MLSLEEAIKHCEEVAEKNETKGKMIQNNFFKLRRKQKQEIDSCLECAKEHRQLADWLRELKTYKDFEDIGYVMCRVVVTQDIQGTTRVTLDVNTEKLYDKIVEVEKKCI